MADIIDIIHKLSYDIDDSGLQAVMDMLQKQAAGIELLKQKLAELSRYYDMSGSVQQQGQLKIAIDKTTEAVKQQTGTLLASLQTNKVFQEAIKGQLTLFNNLKEKLEGIKKVSSEAGLEGISNIATSLNGLANGMSELGKAGGALNTLLGGSLGKLLGGELFKGLEAIAPEIGAVVELGSALVNLGSEFVNTEKKQEEFKRRSNDLVNTFLNEADALEKLNQQYLQYNVGGDTQPDEVKRDLDLTVARGVQNGNEYDFDKNVLDKTTAHLEAQRKSVAGEIEDYRKLSTALSDAMHSVGDKPYTSKRPDNSNKEVIKRTFKASGADQEILSQILQGIDEENKKETNKYGYGGITESKLRTILGNTAARFSKKADQLTNDAANIANDEDVAKANFDTKNRVGAERLGKNLEERIDKGNADLQQHRLKDQEQTSETIKKQLDIEKDYQLKILQEEQTEAEKKGTLSVANAQKFAQLRNLIVQKYNNELLQENKEFLEKKAEQSANASDTLDVLQNTSNIKNDQSRIEENKQNETPALGAYTQLADDKNLKLQRDFDAEQERIQNEFNAAQFDSEDTKNAKALQIQEQFEESQLTLIHAMNANKLAAYSDFFTELDKEAKDKIAKILADEELGADQQIEKLSEKLVNGKISRTDYAYQKRLIGLDEGVKEDNTKLQANTAEQGKVQEQLKAANQTPAQMDALTLKLAKLQDEAVKLSTDINEKEDAIKKAHTEHIEEQIDKYSELVKTVVSAYDQIYEAQQRALDREIQIREKRVQQANILAERGNTQALQQEQSLLDKAQRQRELAAKRQVEINAALSASEAVLAVVKAAAEGDPYTIAIRVIAAVASIAAGVASIKATTQSEASLGFAQGGYTGDGARYQIAGPVHRGEFVFDQDKTRIYRPLFEAIHNGVPMFERMPDRVALRRYEQSTTINNAFATRHDMNLLAEKLDDVADAIGDIKVEQHIGENGVRQMVQTSVRKERKRWKI